MICVNRGTEPAGFTQRAQNWWARFNAERIDDDKLTISKFWNKVRREVQADAEQLYLRSHGKCAFCESRMADVANPHVEHYRPKSKFPELAFTWNNWLLSCKRCNDKKWVHFPMCDTEPCLIDPASENPEVHIEFKGYMPIPKTQRGAKTIELVGLDRSPLEDERSDWLHYIRTLSVIWVKVPELRAEVRELLIWAMQDDAPYAAMIRCYLRRYSPKLAEPPHPHSYIALHEAKQRIQQLCEQLLPELERLE